MPWVLNFDRLMIASASMVARATSNRWKRPVFFTVHASSNSDRTAPPVRPQQGSRSFRRPVADHRCPGCHRPWHAPRVMNKLDDSPHNFTMGRQRRLGRSCLEQVRFKKDPFAGADERVDASDEVYSTTDRAHDRLLITVRKPDYRYVGRHSYAPATRNDQLVIGDRDYSNLAFFIAFNISSMSP